LGPLAGLRVIELQGIGPGPYCGMMLADMGAEIVRVDRAANVGKDTKGRVDLLARGRKSVAIDLKHPDGVATVLKLLATADVLIEGFRPGVMERLGLGPDVCLAANSRLVYGRMTGWGQTGTMANVAGHDINYIALSGALHAIGSAGSKPVPPLNLVGDFGGGGMLLAFGILAALFERASSGRGQVVDAAMTDGSALLMNSIFGLMNDGQWRERGTNLLDGGAHFYNTYETADSKWVSIGSIEPQFYALLLEKSGLGEQPDLPRQMARDAWPQVSAALERIFRTKTRDEWDEILLGTDVCYAPVLSFDEARAHPHNAERQTFVDVDGVPQAAPAPRFDRTHPEPPRPAALPGAQTDEILLAAGLTAEDVAELRASQAIA